MSDLTSSLGGYNLLRNRFISTFKRDKLGDITQDNRRIIAMGNRWANGGDVVSDAKLYEGPQKEVIQVILRRFMDFHPQLSLSSVCYASNFKLSIHIC